MTKDAWSITYGDRSGNVFHFHGPPENRFRYDPVRPEMSSSGLYSGGSPKEGALSPSEAEGLRARVMALKAQPEVQVQKRMKGTGDFTVRDAHGEQRFTVKGGTALEAFDSAVAQYRGAP